MTKRRNWREETILCQMCLKSIKYHEGSRYQSNLFLCKQCNQEAIDEEAYNTTRAYRHDKKHKDVFTEVVPIMNKAELKTLLNEYRENPLP